MKFLASLLSRKLAVTAAAATTFDGTLQVTER